MKSLIILLIPITLAKHTPPSGPQGPPGVVFKDDLLRYNGGHNLGAFWARDWEPYHKNNEVQAYRPYQAKQDPNSKHITIEAYRRKSNNKVYSAR